MFVFNLKYFPRMYLMFSNYFQLWKIIWYEVEI